VQVTRTFASDRSWQFDVGVEELWDRLTAVEEYPQWWPWLRRFHPDRGFAQRSEWRCVVAPPLPYVVRFTVVLEDVEPCARVDATVHGDVRGHARLELDTPAEGGSTARLTSRLAPSNPLLRRVATVASPLVQWGHDWVLEQGQRQFVERGILPGRSTG
jgi:hypothetical protein